MEPRFSISGHSYVVFENTTSNTISIGYFQLEPHQKVSVGLWQTCSAGSGSSSSSSDSGHNGVYII